MSSWWPSVQWQTSKVIAVKVTASEVVDVIIAPELEGIDGKVEVLPVVVTGCCFLQRGRNKAAGTRRG